MILLVILFFAFAIIIMLLAMRFAHELQDDYDDNSTEYLEKDKVDDYYEFIRRDKPAPMSVVKDEEDELDK